jgi:prophage regulatory protein
MNKILREPELLKLVGLSRTTLWRRERAGDFPRRRKLSSRSVGWVLSEVLQWIDQRPLADGGERTAAVCIEPADSRKSLEPCDSPETIPGEGS